MKRQTDRQADREREGGNGERETHRNTVSDSDTGKEIKEEGKASGCSERERDSERERSSNSLGTQ